MSLFGSLTGDYEEDPFFGSHMQNVQRMNNMINSMFADPFGMMGPPAIMDGHHPQNRMAPMAGMQMMPFGFPPMPALGIGRMFSDLGNMAQDPNCHSFTSSSIMTMTSSPDGRPQVYQESMSTRTAPGGVKETKKTVSDSRTGTRKMAIGHHIGDRAHIIEREHNVHNDDRVENQEFINLEEEEAETFNQEWTTKIKRAGGTVASQSHRPLALPSTAPPASSRQSKNPSRKLATPRRAIRSAPSPKSSSTTSTSRSIEAASASTSTNNRDSSSSSSSSNSSSDSVTVLSSPESSYPSEQSRSRKRQHTPEPEEGNLRKRLSTSPTQAAPQRD